ncbi:MAG: single-stranded DNA-binding protein [Parcubacteria group bacterium]
MDLNKAMIIGNVTRDPETRSTASGQPVTSFSIATNLTWTDQSGQKQQKAEFHNIVAWRKLAEICGQYLKKGSKVYIEGRLQTSDWTGQDGNKRYKTEIVAENMIMLDNKGGAGAPVNNNYSQNSNEPEPVIQQEEESTDDEEIKVENIPF